MKTKHKIIILMITYVIVSFCVMLLDPTGLQSEPLTPERINFVTKGMAISLLFFFVTFIVIINAPLTEAAKKC